MVQQTSSSSSDRIVRGQTTRRHAAILAEVQRRQRVTVGELSRRFGVSAVSIRRDLERLEALRLLRRTHGGAAALGQGGDVLSLFDARLLQQADVKQAIGRAAAGLARNGEVVLLDSGTTVLEVARHLPDVALTVVTRSLVIANELREQRRPQLRLIVLGGVYQPDFDTFVGAQVESAVQSLHVDTLFAGADGVTLEHGLTTDNVLEAGLFRVMAGRAGKVVVASDSSKIGVVNLQTVLSLGEVHTLITDADAPAPFVKALRVQGVEVIQVPRPEQPGGSPNKKMLKQTDAA